MSLMKRREWIKDASLALAAGTMLPSCQPHGVQRPLKGEIKQVVAAWCFVNQGPKWSMEQFAKTVSSMGFHGVELVRQPDWPILKKYNLPLAAVPSHPFKIGYGNQKLWPEVTSILEKTIDDAADFGCPNVMTFSGMMDTREFGGGVVSKEEGIRNCIEGYKKIVAHAEKKKVNLALESLNTRTGLPMMGHPGYIADHLDDVLEIINKVGSERLKLAFDIYHIQIMDGDLINRIKECKDLIAHVQIAGNPGRAEIGANQEVNYSAVMKALVDVGYKGCVGHEWVPKGDALQGLEEAKRICDV